MGAMTIGKLVIILWLLVWNFLEQSQMDFDLGEK